MRRAARLKEEKARLEKSRHLIEMFTAILNVHKKEFPPVTRTATPSAQQVNRPAIRERYRIEALAGLSLFDRHACRVVKQEADAADAVAISDEYRHFEEEREELQRQIDMAWDELTSIGRRPFYRFLRKPWLRMAPL